MLRSHLMTGADGVVMVRRMILFSPALPQPPLPRRLSPPRLRRGALRPWHYRLSDEVAVVVVRALAEAVAFACASAFFASSFACLSFISGFDALMAEPSEAALDPVIFAFRS